MAPISRLQAKARSRGRSVHIADDTASLCDDGQGAWGARPAGPNAGDVVVLNREDDKTPATFNDSAEGNNSMDVGFPSYSSIPSESMNMPKRKHGGG
ncbi:uncharacterized protein IUM83_16843 [Phytophthora cinnamomi]|uniref:uncharacterized protein n=1 Tax=Phytophthora cinnamomi TaxID=4785 RepID=UPI00355A2681|nr:hypothetical protein IUM83_16843 [Phytophthora cinnamomi]